MNPIITRELVGVLRTRRALLLQVLLVAALSLLVALRWPDDATVNYKFLESQQVLRLFGYGLMVTLMLLAPVFPATAIVREKNQGTLALLLNTPMTSWSIMYGKLLGILGYIGILLVLSMPAAAACYTMGGIDFTGQLLKVYLILIFLSFQYVTLGLLISSFAETTDAALRMTYGAVLGIGVASVLPYIFLQGNTRIPFWVLNAVEWLRCISPIPAMMEVLRHGAIGAQGIQGVSDVASRFAVLAIVSGIVFAVWTALRLNHRLFDRSRAAGKITDDRSVAVQGFRRFYYMWFFDPQRRTGSTPWFVNPVMVKEMRTRRYGRMHWLMRFMGLSLISSLFLTYIASNESMEWGVTIISAVMVLMQTALIILITPSLASGLISTERETGGWTLLQMTPLSAVSIVWGKLQSVLITLGMILFATLPSYVVMYYIEYVEKSAVPAVLITLLLMTAVALLLSAAISSLVKKTAVATTVSYTVLMILCAGTMLIWLGEDAPFSHRTVELVLRFNPLAAALSLLNAPGFIGYRLLPANWYIMGAVCVGSIVVLARRLASTNASDCSNVSCSSTDA